MQSGEVWASLVRWADSVPLRVWALVANLLGILAVGAKRCAFVTGRVQKARSLVTINSKLGQCSIRTNVLSESVDLKIMKVKSFTFNPFQENTYIISDDTGECLIIDPGCYTLEEKNQLKQFIIDEKLIPVKLVNTHCHIDHILGNKFASEEWNIQLYLHKEELPLLKHSVSISKMYGLEKYEKASCPKHFLKQDDILSFGNSNFKILFTPGHAPGHICLYNEENNTICVDYVLRYG